MEVLSLNPRPQVKFFIFGVILKKLESKNFHIFTINIQDINLKREKRKIGM